MSIVELIRLLRSGDQDEIMRHVGEIADLLEEMDERIAIMAEGCRSMGITLSQMRDGYT